MVKGKYIESKATRVNKKVAPVLCVFVSVFLLVVVSSCTISYSFTGASISPDVKTFAINEFVTRTANVSPTYPEYVVEELRKKFIRQTSLSYGQTAPDLEFEGSITTYDIKPMSMSSAEQEAMNRLTVTIQVKFTNNKNHDQDFDETFTQFSDFSTSVSFSDVEESLLKEITEKIISDIFNKSVANW
jgi:hypothetical protein